jgi:hypothetical protein
MDTDTSDLSKDYKNYNKECDKKIEYLDSQLRNIYNSLPDDIYKRLKNNPPFCDLSSSESDNDRVEINDNIKDLGLDDSDIYENSTDFNSIDEDDDEEEHEDENENPSNDDESVEDEMLTNNRLKMKLVPDFIEKCPYIAIKNEKMIRWKFNNKERNSTSNKKFNFSIYSIITKNFESVYVFLNELIDQLDNDNHLTSKSFNINDNLWIKLIDIACKQTFINQLKIVNLLIKIIKKEIDRITQASSQNEQVCLFFFIHLILNFKDLFLFFF